MKKALSLLGVLVALAALSGGGWYVARDGSAGGVNTRLFGAGGASGFAAASADADANAPVTGPLAPPRKAPTGYREYRNEQYRFAFFAPQDLSTQAYDEGGGAATYTFQNVQTAQGFQIFAVPYGGTQVSQERFRKDVPSGVMRAPQDVSIDGATATAFFSADSLLGDTAEVWFIHGGYLFEVTAPKSEAAWLSEIMATWKWI